MQTLWRNMMMAFLVVVLTAGCGGGKSSHIAPQPEQAKAAPTDPSQTWTIAVFPFSTQGEPHYTGGDVSAFVIAKLKRLGGFSIPERQALDSALGEFGLGQTDLVDPASRTQIGRALGAHYLCFGMVNERIETLMARVVETETQEIILIEEVKYEGKREDIETLAQRIADGLRELPPRQAEQQQAAVEQEVQVKGYGAIINGDYETAEKLALKDAYARAISQVCGVKLIRQTQIENFQLVKDSILTESVGYVTSYEVLARNPDTSLGYEVLVSASVSSEPLSDTDKLALMVKYLLAEPRIAVVLDGEHAATLEARLLGHLQQAGFSVVDIETIGQQKQKFAELHSQEEAARLASALDAEVLIRGQLESQVTTRIEQRGGKPLDFPIVIATVSGGLRAVSADTGQILYTLSHEDIDQEQRQGSGNTEEAAISRSLDNFIAASANRLAWDLSQKLGEPVRLRVELHNADFEQAKEFGTQIAQMPDPIKLFSAEMSDYYQGRADYQVEAPSKKLLQQQLLALEPTKLGAESMEVQEPAGGGIILVSLQSDRRNDRPAREKPQRTNLTPDPEAEATAPELRPTGVILDASAVEVAPALYPKVYALRDGQLEIVYGDTGRQRPAEDVALWAAWVQSLDEARTNRRVQGNPLVIEVADLRDEGMLIRTADADRIENLETEHQLLQRGNVVIVYSDTSAEK